MTIIDKDLLNIVSVQAKDSPRLRMNYNFHGSLEDKCHNYGSRFTVHGSWFMAIMINGSGFMINN